MSDRRPSWPLLALLAALLLSLLAKLAVLKVGAPFVSIDDRTTFEGGFLVWFGQAPPQRMYLECWLAGAVSLANYALRVLTHAAPGGLGLNLVADAYRDYYVAPDSYAHAYRLFAIAIDLLAGGLVWRLGRRALGDAWRGWAAVLPAIAFLLTYNTVWADIVARPDSLLPLFMVGGLLMYYRSDFGRHPGWLLGAGFTLGLGAGLKMHMVFAVAFLAGDLVRVLGWREALRRGWAFVALSVLAFLVSAGIPLFDPLKYVKLRVTNAKDDASPWIKWGEEFVVMLRGTGWLALPLVLGALLHRAPDAFRRRSPVAASLAFQAVRWLIVFAAIRQLRAYWMLPALPVFYVMAAGFLVSLAASARWRRAAPVLAVALVTVLAVQTAREVGHLRASRQDGLRAWIRGHVQRDEPFYVFGYDGLVLPRSTHCLGVIAAGIERGLREDRAAGQPFTSRHLKNWEEENELKLQDLLGGTCAEGWEYYSFYSTPPDKYADLVDLGSMRYVMVEEKFDNPPGFPLPAFLADGYTQVAEATGAGGRGYGLKYRIYARRDAQGG